jgi:hypothetical protein
MADSETTKKQKRRLFENIQSWVSYLETHGLECINYYDLKIAENALDKTDVGVRDER